MAFSKDHLGPESLKAWVRIEEGRKEGWRKEAEGAG